MTRATFYQRRRGFDPVDSNVDFKAAVQNKRIGAELWLWVLGIVLLLAGLETFLAQKFSQSK